MNRPGAASITAPSPGPATVRAGPLRALIVCRRGVLGNQLIDAGDHIGLRTRGWLGQHHGGPHRAPAQDRRDRVADFLVRAGSARAAG
jgi:hypothetical protein